MKNTFIGSPVERREDLRFVRGRGQYVDDLQPDGLLYAVILRSSVAHGRIRAIASAAALEMRGVHAVITANDMAGGPPKIAMRLQPLPDFKPFEQPVIAHDRVRYVGEPVALVLAESIAIGEDALERIVLDVEPLPAVTDCAVAAQGDRLLFEDAGTNSAMTFTAACGDADRAFAQAAYVRRETLRTQRHYGLTMEPRGLLAWWDGA
ncbi:MAG: xanthine dehydrogenase family protein molybdopterin-binding subunit, partial [Xanthobacteraceae bacterium]|nr:xanthine dehydrogenase family protein molybdopterin-binding subunit [Xanthobacteraceae bacterium]